jgi:hypothetical protein
VPWRWHELLPHRWSKAIQISTHHRAQSRHDAVHGILPTRQALVAGPCRATTLAALTTPPPRASSGASRTSPRAPPWTPFCRPSASI